jgi:Flp pilus assembly protein TadG
MSRLRSGLQRARNAQGGSSMVETALVLPAFCLLLFGIFSFSMLLISYLSATYCLRQAARYGGLHSLTSTSPASINYLTNLVTSSIFLPSATAPTITVSYVNYFSGVNGNYVGNAVVMTMNWSQLVNIPFYSTILSLSNQTYRMITQ